MAEKDDRVKGVVNEAGQAEVGRRKRFVVVGRAGVPENTVVDAIREVDEAHYLVEVDGRRMILPKRVLKRVDGS